MKGLISILYIAFMSFGKDVSDMNARENARRQAKNNKLESGDVYFDSKGRMYDAGTDIRIYTLHDEKTGHTEGYACSDGHFVVDITRVQNLRKEKKLYDAGFRIFPTVGTEHGEHYHKCRIGRLPLAYYKIYFEKTVTLGKEKNIECREKKYYVIKESLRTYYFDPESETAIRSTDEQRISDVKIKLEADARGHGCPDYKTIDDKNIEKINKTIKGK